MKRKAITGLSALPACLLVAPAIAQQSFPELQTQLPGYGQQPAYGRPSGAMQQPGNGQPSGYGQQPGFGQPSGYGQTPAFGQQPGFGQPNAGMGGDLDSLAQMERQDFGVQPQNELRSAPMHGPTPNQIPGGQVITTKGVNELMQKPQLKALVFDVLGAPSKLPNAIPAVAASEGGTFSDQTQKQLGDYLQQVTGGNRETPLVFYCQGTHCWMSYNAALRAINLGYPNVLWYRGGLDAWQQAGLQTQPQ
ncbi:MAG: hypothetical protein LJE91_17900 [Gammaproteobacteria bacterium]|jgi:PQQ-dependent catabolism-associated CXXCW motif protein|nr:hypothetical protein [Gammaproteobacteria bacterium]